MGFLKNLFSRSSDTETDDPLDRLIIEATENPARREAFYRELLRSRLWVPGELHDGEALIRPYELEDRKTILIFSSPERMVEGLRDRPEFFGANGRALLESLPPFDSLLLNYRTRTQKEFTPSEVAAILDGSIFAPEEGGHCASRSMIVGQPKEYPVRLMEELKRRLPARAEVQAAYLAQITGEGSDAPHIIIAFETGMGGPEFELLRSRATELAAACGAEGVEFTRLANDALGEYMRKESEPFYRAASLEE
jgi:hypothetical protein